jgi:hypothetical protein
MVHLVCFVRGAKEGTKEETKKTVAAPLRQDTSPVLIEFRDCPKKLSPSEVRQTLSEELLKAGISVGQLRAKGWVNL